MSSNAVVIVAGARTPMGGLMGALSSVPAPELAATAIAAGIPTSTGAVTVNKACGSGMQATIFGYDSIMAGTNTAVITGGMESMSRAPHMLPGARGGIGSGHSTVCDHMFTDGLEDAYTGRAMGILAQETVDERGITREQMDAFAIESLTRARNAIEAGSLRAEIAPVTVKTRKSEVLVEVDEQPHKAAIEKIPALRPAFAKDGSITAANASSISDGASALLLMSEAEAAARKLKPMARIVAHSRHSQAPSEFTVAPIGAIKKLFEKTGWNVADVDLFEINEAFAAQVLAVLTELGISDDGRVNQHGGGIALGAAHRCRGRARRFRPGG